MSTDTNNLAIRAAQIISEERRMYCTEALGWSQERAEAFTREPAMWVQSAVERALAESRQRPVDSAAGNSTTP